MTEIALFVREQNLVVAGGFHFPNLELVVCAHRRKVACMNMVANRLGIACATGPLAVVLLLSAFPAVAQDQFRWTTHYGTITITKYIGSVGAVEIPAMIVGLPVTTIGGHAFQGGGLGSVIIPNSVTSIAEYAFEGCRNLTNVTIPDSVSSIGDSAFGECSGLTSITIPHSVTNLGVETFNNCSSLSNVTIPASITSIPAGAFGGCDSLTNITIPDNVASIGDGAFGACSNLTSIRIPNSVTHIGGAAFGACSRLTNVTIGNALISSGGAAFDDCPGLAGVKFQGNAPFVTPYPMSRTSLGGPVMVTSAFSGANNATVYYLPSTTGWGPVFDGRPTALWKP